MTLREYLNDLCSEFGQGTVADKIGTDASTLSRFLSGQNGLMISALAKALELGKTELVSKKYMIQLEDTIEMLGDLWRRERRKRLEEK